MKVNVVWLKRDVRLHDHAVLNYAMHAKLPILLLYLFEPSVMSVPESDPRHWQFAYQGVKDLEQKVGKDKLLLLHMEALQAFNVLRNYYFIREVLSHQETGLEITYRRDLNYSPKIGQ